MAEPGRSRLGSALVGDSAVGYRWSCSLRRGDRARAVRLHARSPQGRGEPHRLGMGESGSMFAQPSPARTTRRAFGRQPGIRRAQARAAGRTPEPAGWRCGGEAKAEGGRRLSCVPYHRGFAGCKTIALYARFRQGQGKRALLPIRWNLIGPRRLSAGQSVRASVRRSWKIPLRPPLRIARVVAAGALARADA